MNNSIERFGICWEKFKSFYTKNISDVLDIDRFDGTPSKIIWNESDIQLHLAKNCIEEFGEESVHMEVGLDKIKSPGGKTITYPIVDIAIIDPQRAREIWEKYEKNDFNNIQSIFESTCFDVIIEIAIILNENENDQTYGYGKIIKLIESAENILSKRRSRHVAICTLIKNKKHNKNFYADIEFKLQNNKSQIQLLKIIDDEK